MAFFLLVPFAPAIGKVEGEDVSSLVDKLETVHVFQTDTAVEYRGLINSISSQTWSKLSGLKVDEECLKWIVLLSILQASETGQVEVTAENVSHYIDYVLAAEAISSSEARKHKVKLKKITKTQWKALNSLFSEVSAPKK